MIVTDTVRSPRGFLRDLKEKCKILEENVRYKDLATEDELTAYAPGGAENSARNQSAWVFFYATLVRFTGREELKESQRGHATADAECTILDALRDAPVSVELQPVGESPPRRISVHPKSFEALQFIDRRDHTIIWLNEQNKKLLPLPVVISLEAIAAFDRETLHQYGLIAYAVTHAGAGLPFPVEDPPATLPDWIKELSTVDVILIHNAYIECNALRIATLYLLLERTTGETQSDNRLSWATFFSARAEDTGIEPRSLMRDRSLASQIAAALIAAEQRNRALAEAKNTEEAA